MMGKQSQFLFPCIPWNIAHSGAEWMILFAERLVSHAVEKNGIREVDEEDYCCLATELYVNEQKNDI